MLDSVVTIVHFCGYGIKVFTLDIVFIEYIHIPCVIQGLNVFDDLVLLVEVGVKKVVNFFLDLFDSYDIIFDFILLRGLNLQRLE